MHKSINIEINTIFNKFDNLEKLTNEVLSTIGDFNKKWLEFYPEFSSTYKLRSNLTENEYNSLVKMRFFVDDFYPFSAGLDQLLRDAEFTHANFTEMSESMSAYLEKTQLYCRDFVTIIDDYETIVKFTNIA
jgi:hypothetical protein